MSTSVNTITPERQTSFTFNLRNMAYMSIGENIKKLRKAREWSQVELAKRVGISRVRITQIESDPTTHVRGDTLLNLAKVFGCEPRDLEYGWGSEAPAAPAEDFVNIPMLNVELSSGAGRVIDQENIVDYVPISRAWIDKNNLAEQRLATVQVHGDSMASRIQDGDTVLVDTSQNMPISGKVYVISVDNELRIKRLFKRMDGSWTISSDNKTNPEYCDEVIAPHNAEQLRVIGRAIRVVMGEL
ncbi:MAG: S24 family peptidase [Amphritea sp.]